MKKSGKFSNLMTDVKKLFGKNEDSEQQELNFEDEIYNSMYDDDFDDYEDDYSDEEDNPEYDENIEPKQKKGFFSLLSKDNRDNKDVYDDSHDNIQDAPIDNIVTIIYTPKSFEDCNKIAQHIKADKMITLNFEKVDIDTMQRILDFLSGAMYIKNAAYAEVTSKVYTVVPEKMKIHFEGVKKSQDKIIHLERGE